MSQKNFKQKYALDIEIFELAVAQSELASNPRRRVTRHRRHDAKFGCSAWQLGRANTGLQFPRDTI